MSNLGEERDGKGAALQPGEELRDQEPTIGGSRFVTLPVQYVIQAPDFERLRAIIPKFMEKASADKTFRVVDLNLKFNKPSSGTWRSTATVPVRWA